MSSGITNRRLNTGGAAGFLLVLVMISLMGCGSPATAPTHAPADNPVVTLRLGDTVVRAEVVSTPEKLYLGLGGRRELPWGTGMLFVLPDRRVQSFCMRGMLIPIDIIWIDQGRIIGIHENLQPDDPNSFQSPGPVTMVLEVPAGFVAATKLGTYLKY